MIFLPFKWESWGSKKMSQNSTLYIVRAHLGLELNLVFPSPSALSTEQANHQKLWNHTGLNQSHNATLQDDDISFNLNLYASAISSIK